MNKSSEIYDIAWDLASIVDNLDDSVLNVIRKGTQGIDPNASASLDLACTMLNKNIEQLKSLVASLEEITFSLEEELENIYSWCRIQECCYEQSIRFSYDIQVPAHQIKIPKLIIQPLIENAVVHGANFAGEDARICLHIWMEGKCLYIVVWDNGTDVDTDRINRLACGKGEVCSDSLGVRNVYERIRLRYGSAGQMRFEQDEEHHTLVQIVIPAEMDQSL